MDTVSVQLPPQSAKSESELFCQNRDPQNQQQNKDPNPGLRSEPRGTTRSQAPAKFQMLPKTRTNLNGLSIQTIRPNTPRVLTHRTQALMLCHFCQCTHGCCIGSDRFGDGTCYYCWWCCSRIFIQSHPTWKQYCIRDHTSSQQAPQISAPGVAGGLAVSRIQQSREAVRSTVSVGHLPASVASVVDWS